jgi:F-type H+-transporting ATPase subunit b
LLKSLDERSDRIRKDYEDAEKARKEGERLVDEYEKKLAEIDKLMREKIQQASEEGNALATSIKEEARKEASSILEKARENIEREIASARMGLRNEIVELAIEYAEKVIHYELDEKKHAELVERFLDEMEEELT